MTRPSLCRLHAICVLRVADDAGEAHVIMTFIMRHADERVAETNAATIPPASGKRSISARLSLYGYLSFALQTA